MDSKGFAGGALRHLGTGSQPAESEVPSVEVESRMPCWRDLWQTTWALRWLAVPALFVVLIILMLWAPGIRRRSLRLSLRITGGLIALFVVVVLGPPLFLGFLFYAGTPRAQFTTIASASGLHRAILMYQSGFLGRDFSRVQITKTGSCQHFTAYEYHGPSELEATKLVWLDDRHLQIQYFVDKHRPQHCEAQVTDVSVACIPVPPRN